MNVISLIFIDLISFYVTFFIAYYFREFLSDIYDLPSADLYALLHSYWIPLLYILLFLYTGLYTKRNFFWDETRDMLKLLTIATILIFSIISILKLPENISRSFILLFWLISLFVFPVFRFYGKRLLYRLHIWNENLLILGHNERAVAMAELLKANTYLGYRVCGFISMDRDSVHKKIEVSSDEYEIVAHIDDYCKAAYEHDAEVVLVAIFGVGAEKLSEIITDIQQCSRRVLVIPETKGLAMQNTQLLHMYSRQMFLLEINNNLKTVLNRTLKKIFDYTLAIILLPFLLPVIIILGIIIKLDSKGSIFFIQDRLGYQGRKFKCIKFRTMHENNDEILQRYLETHPDAKEEYQIYKKLKGYDPRVTRMGRFFRKTSLDELAQIFNILKGEMSFVGPRPYLPSEKNEMGKYVDIILKTEPGITGLWQISGRNNLSFEKRVSLDVWYVLNWSLWRDISILIKTVKVVLKREGAY